MISYSLNDEHIKQLSTIAFVNKKEVKVDDRLVKRIIQDDMKTYRVQEFILTNCGPIFENNIKRISGVKLAISLLYS